MEVCRRWGSGKLKSRGQIIFFLCEDSEKTISLSFLLPIQPGQGKAAMFGELRYRHLRIVSESLTTPLACGNAAKCFGTLGSQGDLGSTEWGEQQCEENGQCDSGAWFMNILTLTLQSLGKALGLYEPQFPYLYLCHRASMRITQASTLKLLGQCPFTWYVFNKNELWKTSAANTSPNSRWDQLHALCRIGPQSLKGKRHCRRYGKWSDKVRSCNQGQQG